VAKRSVSAGSLTWAVPVSHGFGRRLRYLVWDRHNGKLIGLMAIGDPVFNLSVRDKLIGWNSHARGERLVNIMDAYVLGAVPPYNMLLGGKLVAALIRTRDGPLRDLSNGSVTPYRLSAADSICSLSVQSRRVDERVETDCGRARVGLQTDKE
jgi:hypothetical protein